MAATPRPADPPLPAGSRATVIARLICWAAVAVYAVVLTLQLILLYAA